MVATFFGLTEQYIEGVYDHLFQLKYYGGWSFFESYNLPVPLRSWFLARLIKQKSDEAGESDQMITSEPSGRGRSYKA